MKTVGIGEAARLVGVKPHVLRYWESELPLLAPRKGRSGRREYTAHDLQLLLRLKHLLHDQRYTLEGARRELWDEVGSPHPDLRARLDAVRSDLVEALMLIQERTAGPVADRDPREAFEAIGQGHLFAHWDARPAGMRRRLLEDLETLDAGLVASLAGRLAAGPPRPSRVEPASFASLREIAADREARGLGEELVASGRTAFLTVAGGQGSRLGFEGPKGLFPVTPLRRLTLFALFAEKLLAARRRYGAAIPWLIMTSRGNHEDTRRAFERADWFGLGAATVRFFTQGMLPALSPDGRLLLAADGGLFWSPDGHGGVIGSLRSSGLLAELAAAGVEELFHFQVDNPLVTVPDPVFLGFHRRAAVRRLVEGRREVGTRGEARRHRDDRRPAGGDRVLGPGRRAAGRPRRAGPAALRAGLDRHPRAAGRLPRPGGAQPAPAPRPQARAGPHSDAGRRRH